MRQGGKGRTVASHPQLLIIYTAKTGGGNGLGTRLLIVLSNLYCASRTWTVHFFSGSVRVHGDLVVIIHFVVMFHFLYCVMWIYIVECVLVFIELNWTVASHCAWSLHPGRL